jgi:hypothetical protein
VVANRKPEHNLDRLDLTALPVDFSLVDLMETLKQHDIIR